MKIKSFLISMYGKSYIKGKSIDFVKTRPLLNSKYEILKFKQAYCIHFTKEEIKNYILLANPYTLHYSLLLKYFMVEYPVFKDMLNLVDVYESYTRIYGTEDEVILKVFYTPDAKKLTNETKRDVLYKKIKENKEDNYRVINNIMSPVLLSIMDKYKLVRRGDDFYFDTNQDAINFVRAALENTIVKDLAENGIKVKLNKKYQKLSCDKQIFSLKNAILDLNGIKDD